MARQTYSSRRRRYVAICAKNNRKEAKRSSPQVIERELRQRLTEAHPDVPIDLIEQQVAQVMASFEKRTTTTPPPARKQVPTPYLRGLPDAEITRLLGDPNINDDQRRFIRREVEIITKERKAAEAKRRNDAKLLAEKMDRKQRRGVG